MFNVNKILDARRRAVSAFIDYVVGYLSLSTTAADSITGKASRVHAHLKPSNTIQILNKWIGANGDAEEDAISDNIFL